MEKETEYTKKKAQGTEVVDKRKDCLMKMSHNANIISMEVVEWLKNPLEETIFDPGEYRVLRNEIDHVIHHIRMFRYVIFAIM